MVIAQRRIAALSLCIAVIAGCSSDDSRVNTDAGANPNSRATPDATAEIPPAGVATDCTKEAQVSIFRPTDFSQLVNRSALVVMGRVTGQTTEVVTFNTPESTPLPEPAPPTSIDEVNVQLPPKPKVLYPPNSFQVTYVDSTVSVERSLFSAKPNGTQSSVVVRTMAEGPTCDRRDTLPLKDQQYVLFLNTADVAPNGTDRYYTVGGSWSGRLIVEGDKMRSDTPAGTGESPASKAVAGRQLSSLPAEIASARQPK